MEQDFEKKACEWSDCQHLPGAIPATHIGFQNGSPTLLVWIDSGVVEIPQKSVQFLVQTAIAAYERRRANGISDLLNALSVVGTPKGEQS